MNYGIKKNILFAGLVFLAASCGQPITADRPAAVGLNNYSHQLQIGGQTLNVEIASNSQDIQTGLSGRALMRNDQGMLFDFRNFQNRRPGFWMKEMKFNLDFIWINQNKIVGITKNVPAPKTQSEHLDIYYPPANVDMVLEVNAGRSDSYKINIGDAIKLILDN